MLPTQEDQPTSTEKNTSENEEQKQEWIIQQDELKKQLVTVDDIDFNPDDLDGTLRFIGGVDISFDKNEPTDAIASLIVLSFPDLKVVYEKYDKVKMNHPYIPGLEVPHLEIMITELKQQKPQFVPQIILVDGNGVMHQRGFGLASHLGVVVGIPTIGVAKTLLYVDGITIEMAKNWVSTHLKKKGDTANLIGESGKVHGVILQPIETTGKPLYISIGHRVSLDTSVKVVLRTCIHKNPEPIRQADLRSRRKVESEASQKKQSIL